MPYPANTSLTDTANSSHSSGAPVSGIFRKGVCGQTHNLSSINLLFTATASSILFNPGEAFLGISVTPAADLMTTDLQYLRNLKIAFSFCSEKNNLSTAGQANRASI